MDGSNAVMVGRQVGEFNIPERFAALTRLITRDLNNYRNVPTFKRYSKEEISEYLANPYRYEKRLREAVIYIYGASSHFRRLIQYFVGLTLLSYVVSPYRIDPRKANKKTINNNYRKVLNMLSSMNIGTQIPKILTVLGKMYFTDISGLLAIQ